MENTAQALTLDHLHGTNGVTEKIKKAMYESAKQFVYIGFLLKEVKEYKYYEEGGYPDVYAYAEAELNFKRTSTKNFIAIAENFGTTKYTYKGALRTQQCMTLQPEYEKFNYGQLVELLAMSEKQREKATPDMTVRQLRELKREVVEPTEEVITFGQTSDQQSEAKSTLINNYWSDLIGQHIIKLLCIAGKIKYNPKSYYDIEIRNHNDNPGQTSDQKRKMAAEGCVMCRKHDPEKPFRIKGKNGEMMENPYIAYCPYCGRYLLEGTPAIPAEDTAAGDVTRTPVTINGDYTSLKRIDVKELARILRIPIDASCEYNISVKKAK